MYHRKPFTAALIALLALGIGACRPMAIHTEQGPVYTLEVVNPMPHPMIVSYEDGRGTRLLGTVSARGEAEFVIARPATESIVISATDEARTHTVHRNVTLTPDAPARVTLGS